jgi:hypothetical protein
MSVKVDQYLMPCPFCASEDVEIYCIDDGYNSCRKETEETWAVECNNCTAEGPWGKTKEDGCTLWNSRVHIAPIV